MNLREKTLYHQIHPVKLAADVGVTPIALYCVWEHQPFAAVLVGFVPPLLVSVAMMLWTPDLERLKASRLGRYLKSYMTPLIATMRFLTLVPMAYGAWRHQPLYIVIGFVILVVVWCGGLVNKRRAVEPGRLT